MSELDRTRQEKIELSWKLHGSAINHSYACVCGVCMFVFPEKPRAQKFLESLEPKVLWDLTREHDYNCKCALCELADEMRSCDCGEVDWKENMSAWHNDAGEVEGYHCEVCSLEWYR